MYMKIQCSISSYTDLYDLLTIPPKQAKVHFWVDKSVSYAIDHTHSHCLPLNPLPIHPSRVSKVILF